MSIYGNRGTHKTIYAGIVTNLAIAKDLTMCFRPREMLLNIEIQFQHSLSAKDITQAIDRLESKTQSHYPDIRNIFVEAKSLTGRKDNR